MRWVALMYADRPDPANRIRALLLAAAIQLALGYVLINGLVVGFTARAPDDLKLFGVAPDAPPPPREKIVPPKSRDTRKEGAAAPPNIHSKPTEIVAPPPVVVAPPPPVVTAPIAGTQADATQGASDRVGPGTGSGGIGNGTGSGGSGDGDGGGWADETPPRWLKGRIKDSDFPRDAAETGMGGTVSVRYLVGVDGRVTDCEVTRSSHFRELDQLTCRLIEERFRYAPSRDARGRPVAAMIVEDHSWDMRD